MNNLIFSIWFFHLRSRPGCVEKLPEAPRNRKYRFLIQKFIFTGSLGYTRPLYIGEFLPGRLGLHRPGRCSAMSFWTGGRLSSGRLGAFTARAVVQRCGCERNVARARGCHKRILRKLPTASQDGVWMAGFRVCTCPRHRNVSPMRCNHEFIHVYYCGDLRSVVLWMRKCTAVWTHGWDTLGGGIKT